MGPRPRYLHTQSKLVFIPSFYVLRENVILNTLSFSVLKMWTFTCFNRSINDILNIEELEQSLEVEYFQACFGIFFPFLLHKKNPKKKSIFFYVVKMEKNIQKYIQKRSRKQSKNTSKKKSGFFFPDIFRLT